MIIKETNKENLYNLEISIFIIYFIYIKKYKQISVIFNTHSIFSLRIQKKIYLHNF